MLYSLATIDRIAIKRQVNDALQLKISWNKNGDYLAKWYCIRPIQYLYDDLIPNNIVRVIDKWLN